MKPLAIAAGLLACPTVNAFLIPPEISQNDIEIAGNVAAALASAPQISEIQPIDLECPGCPILVKGRSGFDVQVQTDAPSHLELTFSIEHQPQGGDRLVVNGFELYPNADPFSNALVAPQVLDKEVEKRHDHDHNRDHSDGHRKRPHHRRPEPQPQRLGFGMHVGPAKKTQDGEFDLIEVELQIIEVGFSFVEDIPSLKINLIKQNSGKLLMTHIEKVIPQKEVDAPDAQTAAEECATVMCQIMALTREKVKQFNKLKPSFGCHGGKNKGGMMRPEGHGHPHHPRPHGIRPDHLKFPQQREHSWGKLFKNIFAHILLPVLVGIVAGVSVSLIGMMVGTVIVSTWRFFFRKPSSSHRHHRRHSRSHSHNKVSHKEAIAAEEKSGLMVEEAPPTYADDVPPYEDVVPADKPAEV